MIRCVGKRSHWEAAVKTPGYLESSAGVISAALTASETLLDETRSGSPPKFTVTDYVGNIPREIDIDRDRDGRPDGHASVHFDKFLRPEKIEIDRNGDGEVDSKIQFKRNFFGALESVDYYQIAVHEEPWSRTPKQKGPLSREYFQKQSIEDERRAQSEVSYSAEPARGGPLNQRIRVFEFNSPITDKPAGSVKIDYDFFGPTHLRIDPDADGDYDMRSKIDRVWTIIRGF
jgi:hypothetical protein